MTSRPPHQVTTRHLGAAYPMVAGPSAGPGGVVVGRDLSGAPFAYDPFVLYARGVLTNPNMVVFGQIGRGKSALVKTYLWRQSVFGRRAWVVDPKGEYGPLAEHWGVAPVRLRPGGHLRLNPLDAPPADDRDHTHRDVVRRRAELLSALAAAGLGRPLLPGERVAVELAVDEASARRDAPVLPDVVASMLAPSAAAAADVATDPATLAADGRQAALELRRLVAGDLRGMFDGPTTAGVDLSGPLVVLDLSAVYRSPALAVVMTCATAWLHAQLGAPAPGAPAPGPVSPPAGTVVVVDEAWAVLANLAVARWLQASWKLARAWGVANVAVLHRVSDLGAGGAGSEHRQVAHGLLADSETRVVYAQAVGELAEAGRLLNLSPTEAELVPHLGRGVGLWKVGPHATVVRHLLAPAEQLLVGTDGRMPAG